MKSAFFVFLFIINTLILYSQSSVYLTRIKLNYDKEKKIKSIKFFASKPQFNLLILPIENITQDSLKQTSWQIIGTSKEEIDGIIFLSAVELNNEKLECWLCELNQKSVSSCPLTKNGENISWKIVGDAGSVILRQIPARLTFLSDFVLFGAYPPIRSFAQNYDSLKLNIYEPLLGYMVNRTNIRRINVDILSNSTIALPVQIIAAFQIILHRLTYLNG